jgi:hypothetical protein
MHFTQLNLNSLRAEAEFANSILTPERAPLRADSTHTLIHIRRLPQNQSRVANSASRSWMATGQGGGKSLYNRRFRFYIPRSITLSTEVL